MFMGTPAHILAIYWDFARFTLHEASQRGNHGSNKLHSWLYMGKKYSRLSGRQIFWTGCPHLTMAGWQAEGRLAIEGSRLTSRQV
jgi:hypothetical protein